MDRINFLLYSRWLTGWPGLGRSRLFSSPPEGNGPRPRTSGMASSRSPEEGERGDDDDDGGGQRRWDASALLGRALVAQRERLVT